METIKNENPVVLNDFLDYLLKIKNYSLTTISEYRIDLLVFFRFIKKYNSLNIDIVDFNIFILSKITKSDIIAFMVYLNYTRECTASTRKRKISAIKCFFKWLFTFYPIGNLENPAKELPVVQNIERLPKYLSLEKANKLIDIFNNSNSKFPIRNNTIIKIFLNCGLRASELININLSDVNLIEGYIRIIGKGNKERIAWLNKNTIKCIKEYLAIRNKDKQIINKDEPLFLSSRNGRLNLSTVENITKIAFDLAGLKEFGYTTHSLRHTAATLIYQYVTPDILVLKEILGHSSIKSTEIYSHVSNNYIKEAMDRNPLNKVA